MSDFYQLDFHDVETKKSGDAISLRYQINGITYIHVVDGGYADSGETVLKTIKSFYADPPFIDHVVLTHPDGDHAAGLRYIIENAKVGALWMLRPWQYASELIGRFPTYNSVDRLKSRLRACYPHVAALEELAEARGIPIREPFQGAGIGAFTVLAPSRHRYLDLIVSSEKTPEALREESALESLLSQLLFKAKDAIGLIRSAWGEEVFSAEETSPENDMSVIQYANIAGHKILLTGDAGRGGLNEAADYAPWAGLILPGLSRFQVPHHGSRRNVSTETLDRWLGARRALKLPQGGGTFAAIISAADADSHHPRNAVVRACQHRGANVFTTEKGHMCFEGGPISRAGWSESTPLAYPEEQEPA